MRIAIAGGSAAGLCAALLLARDGHEVVVLDRDPLESAPDPEAAAACAFRPAAPQIVHPHALLPRGRELLRQRFPDVLDDLLVAGAIESPLPDQMPPSLADRTPRSGDEQLTMIMSRRSTFDWVLLRAARGQTGICLRSGARVTGLLTKPNSPPEVYGVATTTGDILVDAVVDATGRRSPIERWLADCGARPTDKSAAECGLAYFSRHYRRRPAAALPGPEATRMVAAFDEFTAGIWAADNGTMLFAIAPLTSDRRFHRVADPATFTAVLRTVPPFAAWLDVLDPVGPVLAMSGLHNTMRRLVVDEEPVATGVYAVGDSVCTTNPTLGRGLTLALQNAIDLTDVLRQDPEPVTAAVEFDRRVEKNVYPFYVDQAANDAARLVALRHAVFGHPPPSPKRPQPDLVDFAQLRAAAAVDAVVFRALFRLLGMLDLPETVYRDAEVVSRVRNVLAAPGSRPSAPQPSRADLARALS
jgi:2-polyprenyl-6-methoxyphenol hydroxylase-like FAD-dependent oxidoreductase